MYLQLSKVYTNLSQVKTLTRISYKFSSTDPSNQPFSEAAIRGVPYKKLFLKVLQYSLENNCGGVSFLIKFQNFKVTTLFKRDSNTSVFV